MPAHAPSYFSPAPIVDKTRHHRSRRAVLSSAAFAAALCVFPVSAAFAADPGPQPVTATDIASVSAAPAQLLASTAWETTGAVDQNGAPVALDDPAVRNFVGWAYYNTDGTFTMYNLDDTPKMQGDWEVSPDGTTRTLVAKDATGTTLFTRVVPITVLTAEEFTYRIVPDTAQPDVYVDIIHTPTTHTEPGTVTTDPEPEPEPTDPGTTDPGTTNPGTTDPGTTGPGTTDPGTSTEEPAVPQGDPRSPSKPATTAGGAKAPEQLAVTGADIPALAGVAGAALALLGGTTAVVARVLRRAQ